MGASSAREIKNSTWYAVTRLLTRFKHQHARTLGRVDYITGRRPPALPPTATNRHVTGTRLEARGADRSHEGCRALPQRALGDRLLTGGP